MKKFLLIALFLIPFIGFSQTKPIEGFLGIKFGSSRAAVIAAMKEKGAAPIEGSSQPDFVFFDNVTLGHRATHGFGVKFIDDKAYLCIFLFKAEEDPKAILYYNSLISDINEIYGKGKQNRIFRESFTDGDGYELTAIQSGDADYFTDWKSGPGSVEAKIDSKLEIVLIYQDDALKAAADGKQKTKEKSDF